MTRPRRFALHGRAALAALATVGGTNPVVVAAVVVFITGTAFLVAALEEVSRKVLGGAWAGFAIALFLFLFGAYLWLVRRGLEDLRPTVRTRESPPVRCLILFLSPRTLGSPEQRETQRAFIESVSGSVDEADVRDGFGMSPWRMPIVAIHHQIRPPQGIARLDRVVVVASADGRDRRTGAPLANGTWRDAGAFVELVQRLIEPTGATFAIQTAAETLADDAHAEGVDFENIEAVLDLLHELYRKLKVGGVADDDILLDITGGQKLNSIAGASVAILISGRWFQYVSTRDFQVRSYDVTQTLDTAGSS